MREKLILKVDKWDFSWILTSLDEERRITEQKVLEVAVIPITVS